MTYSFQNSTAFDPYTGEGVPNATGQVFSLTDTEFTAPLAVTILSSGLQSTELVSDQYCQLPGFDAGDNLQVRFRSGEFTKLLNTSDPLIGPTGETGPNWDGGPVPLATDFDTFTGTGMRFIRLAEDIATMFNLPPEAGPGWGQFLLSPHGMKEQTWTNYGSNRSWRRVTGSMNAGTLTTWEEQPKRSFVVSEAASAKQAAIAAALEDATAKVSQAKIDGATDATGKANTAKTDAIADATTKYGGLPARVTAVEQKNTAQDTAITAAKTDAIADATTKYGGLPAKVTTLEASRFFRGHNVVSDVRDAVEQGRYTFGTVPANAPTTALGDLDVHVVGTTIVQEWKTFETVPRTLECRRSGGVWGPWNEPNLKALEGRGILPAGTIIQSLNLPIHNGDWALSSPNWASYVGLPVDVPAGARATLRVTAPNNWTVTHEIHINTGTVHWIATMASPTGPVFNPWQRVDAASLPSAEWIHWGDSLTSDWTLGVDAWATRLAALTGRNHINEGWYGQQAAQIAARQGGNPALMTVEGVTIPASGTSVKVLAATPHVSMPVGTQMPTRRVPGILAGRTGYLVDGGMDATDGYFMPTDGKPLSPAAGKHAFTPTGNADLGRNRIMTICVGENDIWSTGPTPQHVAYMARQMHDYQSTGVKRVLVLSIPRREGSGAGTVTGQKVQAINDALKAEFTSRFIDVAGYLMSDQAAIDASITYTAEDLADIADGVTPRQFRLPGDSVHYNALACGIIAPFIYAAARDRGWL